MAAALELSTEVFRERYTRRVSDPRTGELRLSLCEAPSPTGRGLSGGRCSLLEAANRCSVYAARPRQCRTFPYWNGALNDPHAFERVRSVCPGVAVVPEPERRRAAFAALAEHLAELPPPGPGCTFAEHGESEVWATGLEVDYALAHVDPWPSGTSAANLSAPGPRDASGCPFREGAGCRAGSARPTVCRPAPSDASAGPRLRAVVEDTGYPPGYGPLADMVRSRIAGAGGNGSFPQGVTPRQPPRSAGPGEGEEG